MDMIIGTIAPHSCLACELTGEILCEACVLSVLPGVPSRCYKCHTLTKNNSVCKSCARNSFITSVWVSTYYEEFAKELLNRLKFHRAVAAAKPVAISINETLPNVNQDMVLCPIPTVNSRVRMRGYDQALEITRYLLKISGLKSENLLVRRGKSRQVGSNRYDRFKHLENAFRVKNNSQIKNKDIILIDDVVTTGATIESAAKTLKKAGAKSVNAALFAQAIT